MAQTTEASWQRADCSWQLKAKLGNWAIWQLVKKSREPKAESPPEADLVRLADSTVSRGWLDIKKAKGYALIYANDHQSA